jgi:hypothetical protein
MKVKLIELSDVQIQKVKAKNGERKTFTHAVLCGEYGQIFGTEQHCKKYFNAWSKIFPKLFDGGEFLSSYGIDDFTSTFDLVNILITKNDEIEKAGAVIATPIKIKKKPSFFKKLFS